MSEIAISSTAITSLLDSLTPAILSSIPRTHLPTSFPLNFPTTRHSLNFLSTLHLVYSTLIDPSHISYFAQAGSDVRDTAIRGVMGMYLASSSDWGSDNLLSAEAWRRGTMSEERVGEFIGIETMREREHGTLRGVRVGERWAEGAHAVQDVVRMFRDVGDAIKGDCMGDTVMEAIKRASAGLDAGGGHAKQFLILFADETATCFAQAERSGPDTDDSGNLLRVPEASLRLLQDLAYRNTEEPDPNLPILDPIELAYVCPLLLPIALLCYLGVFDPSAGLSKEFNDLGPCCPRLEAAGHRPLRRPAFKSATINAESYTRITRSVSRSPETIRRRLLRDLPTS